MSDLLVIDRPLAALTTGPKPTGLIGLFGHTYVDQVIDHQFEIIREIKGDRYVVQLFSWADGEPTEVEIVSQTELLGPAVKLYASHAAGRRPGAVTQQ
jgi:hypothetical protein